MIKKTSMMKKLFFSYTAILLVVLGLAATMLSIFVTQYFINQKVDDIIAITHNIERWTGAMHIDENDSRARASLHASMDSWSQFLRADIAIINNDGEITEGTKRKIVIPQEYTKKVLAGEQIIKQGTLDGQYPMRVITVGVPMYYEGTQIGAIFINSWMPDLQKSMRAVILMFVLFFFIAVLVALALVYVQSKKISEPILEINNAVRDIAAGNFSERVSVQSSDEVGQLASSFNFMASSIEKLEENRAAFVSDVSHELRTPMTSISGFIEGILDGTIPKERHEKYLKIVLEESRRLTRLVNDLFEMSKMESSEYKLDIQQFDINELIRLCIIETESKITDKNLDINVDFKSDELIALGDKDCIKRVVLNILDNAIKFSYPNTTLQFKTYIDRRKIYVSIGNFGSGISPDDIGSVFDRFYKSDKSRGKAKSGAGLGLAMVKNIVTMHKQRIWVESHSAKEGTNAWYTEFTFTLETA